MKLLYLNLLIALTGSCGMVLAQKLIFVNNQTHPVELLVTQFGWAGTGYKYFSVNPNESQSIEPNNADIFGLGRTNAKAHFSYVGFLPKTGFFRERSKPIVGSTGDITYMNLPELVHFYDKEQPEVPDYKKKPGLIPPPLPETNKQFKEAIKLLSEHPDKTVQVVFEPDGTIKSNTL